MKMRVVIYVCTILGIIFFHTPLLNRQANASPAVLLSQPHGGMQGNMSLGMTRSPIPQFPHYPAHLLLSAQRACARTAGWSWRDGGFAMCFKPGRNACPTGHPWMRQMTQHYTICLSQDNPAWMPAGMGIY